MTGITRFSYENEHLGWKYNRTEHLNDTDLLVFTHLFSDRNEVPGFKTYLKVNTFVSLNLKDFIKKPTDIKIINQEEKLFILERDDVYEARTNKI